MDGQTLLNCGLVLLFVLIGGVFAATEIALVSLRASQLSTLERAGERGAHVARVARDPNRFLAAVQIGVTVAGLFSASYGGATLAPDLSPAFQQIGMAEPAAEVTALIVLTLAIAYLSLVLGELVPKRLALQKAVGISLAVAPALDRFAALMRPVIWLLSLSTNAMVRALGGDPKATSEELSEDELRELVSTHDALEELERRILADVLAATETTVKEVMQPRGDVAFLAGDLSLAEAAEFVQDLPYSRYPVTDEGFDDVIGFLHVRDLLGVARDDPRSVAEACRRILMLPNSKRLLPSVTTMRQEGIHMAVVVDEYGGTDGIVTLEDLVEELVGDIRDEYDRSDPGPLLDESVVDAGMTIEDFAESTGIALPDGGYETVAGYVIDCLGRIPRVGDRVEMDAWALEVVEMAGTRLTRLRVERDAPGPGRS